MARLGCLVSGVADSKRYALLVTISRCIAFMLQLSWTSSAAKPIEQLRIEKAAVPLIPKFVDARHQRLPEMPHPHLIHRNAGSQRIFLTDNPLRQRRAATGAAVRDRFSPMLV